MDKVLYLYCDLLGWKMYKSIQIESPFLGIIMHELGLMYWPI